MILLSLRLLRLRLAFQSKPASTGSPFWPLVVLPPPLKRSPCLGGLVLAKKSFRALWKMIF